MVNIDEIYHRLNEIGESIKFLENIENTDLDNREKFLLARYSLQIILEAIFTVGNQIIANMKFRKPANYKDILTVLSENKILPKDLHDGLSPYVDLRNRLVHTYWKLSKDELKSIIISELQYFKKFIDSIVPYLNRLK